MNTNGHPLSHLFRSRWRKAAIPLFATLGLGWAAAVQAETVREDFSDGVADNWTVVDGNWSVDNQTYAVGSGSKKVSSAFYGRTFTNFVFEARMMKMSGASTYNQALFFRGNPSPTDADGNWLNGYKFAIGGGEWQLNKVVNGNWSTLQSWTSSSQLTDAYHTWTTLRVVCAGGVIVVYINGVPHGRYQDSSLPSGKVGLTLFDNARVGMARFDDVWLADLTSALGENVGAPALEWTTGGEAVWLPQDATTLDGTGAAESGSLDYAGQQSWLETTVTGPVLLRFWWKHSPYECTDWNTGSPTFGDLVRDELQLRVDGVLQAALHTETDWTETSWPVPDGAHTVRWEYSRRTDYNDGSGQGLAWLDQVSVQTLAPSAPMFTVEPQDRFASEGEQIILQSSASGYPLPTYQWLFNGTALAQATNSFLALPSITAADVGSYAVVASNSLGAVTSRVAQVTVLTLGHALNNAGLVWTTGGNADWRPQTGVSHDGEAAAESGNIGNSEATWLETLVGGPSPITFWWKVSSESGYDFLRFAIDGIEQRRISGNVDWQRYSNYVSAGTHTLRWSYTKDSSVSRDSDAGWVDQVSCSPPAPVLPAITQQPYDQNVIEGDSIWLMAQVSGYPPPACQWFFNGAALPGATAPELFLDGITAANAGAYALVASNSMGVVTSRVAQVSIVTLAESLDATSLVWTTGTGDSGWTPLAQCNHDGADAAESRELYWPGQECWMETTLDGPGTLTFWWKLSPHRGTDWETGSPTFGQTVTDHLELCLNGTLQTNLVDETDWQEQAIEIAPGTQTVRWVYRKRAYDESSGGLGLGWVDEVRFSKGPVITNLLVTGAFTVPEVSTNAYTCLGQWEDGTPTNLTDVVAWRVVGVAPPGTGFQDDRLVVGAVPSNSPVTIQASYTRGTIHLTAMLSVTIMDMTNYPPVWVSNPVTNALLGHPFAYFLQAADADGTELTYSAIELPAWLSLHCTEAGAPSSAASEKSAASTQAPISAGGGTFPLTSRDSFVAPTAVLERAEQFRLYPGEGEIAPTLQSQTAFDPERFGVRRTATNTKDDPVESGRLAVNPLATQFPEITLFVSVLDADGNAVTGLPQGAFEVWEQSNTEPTPTLQSITRFSETVGNDAGISFSLVFDVSGSMAGSQLTDAKSAAINFLDNCSENDRGNLVEFASSDEVQVVVPSHWVITDSDQDGTPDLQEAIASRQDLGLTALFDGTAKGIESLSQEPAPKAVIVFTDGQANDDVLYNINSVIAKSQNEGVPLYTIGLGGGAEEAVLRTLAEQTGGSYYFAPTAADMAAIYSAIAQEVRSRYTLSYVTHNPDYDGTTRTVTVTANDTTGSVVYVVNHRPQVVLDAGTAQLAAQSQPPGVALPIAGTITDHDAHTGGQGLSATLYHRPAGESAYHQVVLNLTSQGNGVYAFAGAIPGGAVVYPGVEWHLRVTDGIQEVLLPFNHNTAPFSISILENHAPVISHTEAGTAPLNQPMTLSAVVMENDPGDSISRVTLFYRIHNSQQTTPYLAVAMTDLGGGLYSGVIPADKVTLAGIDYYVSAWDSHNVRADHGSSVQPHFASVGGCRLVGTPTPADMGTFPVVLEVTDGVTGVQQSFWVTVGRAPLTILRQPASQALHVGATAQFNVTASGTPPLTYQWHFNGVALTGQTNATLALPSVTTNQAGAYSVTVRDVFDTLTSTNALLTVVEIPTFASVLDTVGLAWTSGGSVGGWVAQTTGAHDGVDCAHSTLNEWGESWLETSVTGPGTLTFWWRIASGSGQPPTEYDFGMFSFFITNSAGVEVTNCFLGGPACDWTMASYEIPEGHCTLRWLYVPDTDFSDRFIGWLDDVSFVPAGSGFRLIPLAPLSGGAFQFSLQAPVGSTNVIEASTDLTTWSPIATNTVPSSGTLTVPDPASAAWPQRFYRAVRP